jgi:1-acyl-sn-glycerol-3-phosphate acyltransferase
LKIPKRLINKLGTWNLEPGTWNLEPGTWNLEPGTWNFEPYRADG